MAQDLERQQFDQLFSARSMIGEVIDNNKGYLMGIVPALTAVALPHQVHSDNQAFDTWTYISDLKVELIAATVAALYWGELQHVKAHGKRQKYLGLDKARKDTEKNFTGAWALLENYKPTNETEQKQLVEGIKNEIAKNGVDPKMVNKMTDQTIGLYQAGDEIREGIDSSGGVKMWLEVTKEALQAGALFFSIASVADLFLSVGLPMSNQPTVTFSLTNSESLANLTRWFSLVPLAVLAWGEVRNSRFEEAEYLAGGIEHQAHERAQKNGGHG